MENKKLGQEPAFTQPFCKDDEGYFHTPRERSIEDAGMSKRFYAACAVMQGLSADPNVLLDSKGIESMVGLSYKVADELLKQEFNDEK